MKLRFLNYLETKTDKKEEKNKILIRYSYGFFLNMNNFDYKMVLNPKYGIYNKQNLVQSKTTYSFGAGLIGKMRLNDYFDLRLEPRFTICR